MAQQFALGQTGPANFLRFSVRQILLAENSISRFSDGIAPTGLRFVLFPPFRVFDEVTSLEENCDFERECFQARFPGNMPRDAKGSQLLKVIFGSLPGIWPLRQLLVQPGTKRLQNVFALCEQVEVAHESKDGWSLIRIPPIVSVVIPFASGLGALATTCSPYVLSM